MLSELFTNNASVAKSPFQTTVCPTLPNPKTKIFFFQQPKEKVEKQQLVANGNLESEPNKNIEQHSSPMSAHFQSNGKSSFYQAVGKTVEESYSSTRHRVYVGAVNN